MGTAIRTPENLANVGVASMGDSCAAFARGGKHRRPVPTDFARDEAATHASDPGDAAVSQP